LTDIFIYNYNITHLNQGKGKVHLCTIASAAYAALSSSLVISTVPTTRRMQAHYKCPPLKTKTIKIKSTGNKNSSGINNN